MAGLQDIIDSRSRAFQSMKGKMPSAKDQYRDLLSNWNTGKISPGGGISKRQAEDLAAVAYQQGDDFNVRSNPWKKGAFQAADMATFGLLPDKYFKPDASIGEMYHGSSTADKWAEGLGMGTGALLSGYGLLKGAGMLGAKGYGMWNAWRAGKNAKNVHGATISGQQALNSIPTASTGRFGGQRLYDLVQPPAPGPIF